jgi:type II secretory pathway component PulJ
MFSIGNRKGTTLIELLLGLMIFSLISLAVGATLMAGIRLFRQTERSSQIDFQARLLMVRLARDIENMVPYDYSGSYPDRQAFTGGPDGFSFILARDDGLKTVSYSFQSLFPDRIHTVVMGRKSRKNESLILRHDENALREYLIRREVPLFDHWQGEEGTEEIFSDRDRSHFKFSYAFAANENGGLSWHESWDKKELPRAVRIEMDLGGRRIVKEMFVPRGISAKWIYERAPNDS